jgi:hypothetical protein
LRLRLAFKGGNIDTRLMQPGMYLIVNAIVVTLLVMWILFSRKSSSSQVKLNLRQGNTKLPLNGNQARLADLSGEGEGARSLNVVFQHNGEWYDAYEVLELPAGATAAMVKSQFESLLKSADSEKSKLLQGAYEALFNQGRV